LSVRVVNVPVLAAGNVSSRPIGPLPVRLTGSDEIETLPPLMTSEELIVTGMVFYLTND
jgi:hypothetical protein